MPTISTTLSAADLARYTEAFQQSSIYRRMLTANPSLTVIQGIKQSIRDNAVEMTRVYERQKAEKAALDAVLPASDIAVTVT